jgi:hypothetical protein
MLVIGIGVGLTVPPMTSALLGTGDKQRSGIASGVLNSARQAGSVIGVSLFGSLITPRERFIPGLHAALWVSSALIDEVVDADAVDRRQPRGHDRHRLDATVPARSSSPRMATKYLTYSTSRCKSNAG